jgi:hypothetical protein
MLVLSETATMQTLHPIDPETATGKTKELLDMVQARTGRIVHVELS